MIANLRFVIGSDLRVIIRNGNFANSSFMKCKLSTSSPSTADAMNEIREENQQDAQWISQVESKQALSNFLSNSPKATVQPTSMLELLKTRTNANQSEPHPSQHRTLSSLLTFPMTLSYGLQKVFPLHPLDSLNVLVIGARAESSLPRIWWKELLFSNDTFTKINIQMMGPHVCSSSFTKGMPGPIKWKDSQSNVAKELQFLQIDDAKTKLHQHPKMMSLLMNADVYVLFNSGFGSPVLLSDWDPTIRILLETRKPIISTSHSLHDLKRDLAALDSVSSSEDSQDFGEPLEMLIQPHLNPFASFRRTFDVNEEENAQVVTTNQYIFAFQAK